MKHFFEACYRSPLGRIMSFFARTYASLYKPFMVYGYFDQASKTFQKYTRISSTAIIMNQHSLTIGDHVWVGQYCILDATEGLFIEEGVQIASRASIFTHGSQNSIRLLGNQFVHISHKDRQGYTRGAVKIGKYSFIGTASIVLPGVTIGKGCLIGANTLVNRDVPDYSIFIGSPGEIRGSTIDLDRTYFKSQDFSDTYYDKEALNSLKSAL